MRKNENDIYGFGNFGLNGKVNKDRFLSIKMYILVYWELSLIEHICVLRMIEEVHEGSYGNFLTRADIEYMREDNEKYINKFLNDEDDDI